jgi:hypothetical protein
MSSEPHRHIPPRLQKIEAWQDRTTGEIFASRETAIAENLRAVLAQAPGIEKGMIPVDLLTETLATDPAFRQAVKRCLDALS